MHNPIESITLYYRSGSSDKVYQASIEPADDGKFHVAFAYGRRGATMNTGIKTTEAVDYFKARAVFDKLVRSKTAKGYSPGPDGTPYAGTASETQDTGVQCQLLNPVEEDALDRYLDNPQFMLQEKFDGRRLLVRKHAGEITGINRRGLKTGLPETIATSAVVLPGDFLIDGEAVGDILHAFDLLENDGRDLRDEPYNCRFSRLSLLLATHQPRHIRMVYGTVETSEKREMLRQLRESRREGVVFKNMDTPFTPGRPNSGGDQVKFKFYESASCVVLRRNRDRRSVALGLLSGIHLLECGNVTIPANHAIPASGDVVEVRYLYAYPESNALYQPVYLGARDDIPTSDCLFDQLRFKAA